MQVSKTQFLLWTFEVKAEGAHVVLLQGYSGHYVLEPSSRCRIQCISIESKSNRELQVAQGDVLQARSINS